MRSGGSQNALKIDKNEVRNAPGGFLEASRIQERQQMTPSSSAAHPFWRKSDVLDAILGARWIFNGSTGKKREKGGPGAAPEETWNLDGFSMPKWEALGCENHVFS